MRACARASASRIPARAALTASNGRGGLVDVGWEETGARSARSRARLVGGSLGQVWEEWEVLASCARALLRRVAEYEGVTSHGSSRGSCLGDRPQLGG